MSIDIHFLNVGYGDCTIVHFPSRKRHDGKEKGERVMMVDIYHHDDDDFYENVIGYYKTHFLKKDDSVKPIFRFVCSHPHQDHICGLKKLLDDPDIEILNFWDLTHAFEPEDFEGHPTHEEDWEAYRKLSRENSPSTVIRTKREETPRKFWNDDEDRITILNPCDELVRRAHYKEDGTKRSKHEVAIDEMSYALMIKVNQRKIILAGDGRAEPCWANILENCRREISDCDILKAPHHGHECAFHEEAIKCMSPEIVVISNSKEEDEENGAGELYTDVLPNSEIYRTWQSGTVVVKCPFPSDAEIEVVESG